MGFTGTQHVTYAERDEISFITRPELVGVEVELLLGHTSFNRTKCRELWKPLLDPGKCCHTVKRGRHREWRLPPPQLCLASLGGQI
jgi:hypothetical protein